MKIMAHEMPRSQRVTDEEWRVLLIREAMDASGLSQRELAMRIGTKPVHVCRWLSGVRPVPDRWLMPLAIVMEGEA